MASFLYRTEFSRLQDLYEHQILLKEDITTSSSLGEISPELESGKKEEGYNFYPTMRKTIKRKRKAVNKRPAKDLKTAKWGGRIMRRPLPPGL